MCGKSKTKLSKLNYSTTIRKKERERKTLHLTEKTEIGA